MDGGVALALTVSSVPQVFIDCPCTVGEAVIVVVVVEIAQTFTSSQSTRGLSLLVG